MIDAASGSQPIRWWLKCRPRSSVQRASHPVHTCALTVWSAARTAEINTGHWALSKPATEMKTGQYRHDGAVNAGLNWLSGRA